MMSGKGRSLLRLGHAVALAVLILLGGVADAFPGARIVARRRSVTSALAPSFPPRKLRHAPLSMSLSRGFFRRSMISPPKTTPPKKLPKALWYRDCDAAEEQMTLTHKATPLEQVHRHHHHPNPSELTQDLPLRRSQDVGVAQNNDNMMGAVNLSLVESTCLSHTTTLTIMATLLASALAWGSGDMAAAMANPLDFLGSLYWNSNSAGIGMGAELDVFGSNSYHSLLDWTVTPVRLMEGFIATVPLVAMGHYMVETSQHSVACQIHFSVGDTVMALFGRRRQQQLQGEGYQSRVAPPISSSTTTSHVLFFSLVIAAVSALSEELIFRGLLPTLLVCYTHSVGCAVLVQALLFGFGQIRDRSSFTENGAFTMMQCLNGVWYGAVYLAAGGDLLPVIVAHILYELHIFVGTWKAINDQMDYTEGACRQSSLVTATATRQRGGSLFPKPSRNQDAAGQGMMMRMSPATLDFARRFFYAFDQEHQGTLSLGDVKRAVSYAFLQDDVHASKPPNDDQTSAAFYQVMQQRPISSQRGSEERLSLHEFLRVLFTLKSKSWHSAKEIVP